MVLRRYRLRERKRERERSRERMREKERERETEFDSNSMWGVIIIVLISFIDVYKIVSEVIKKSHTALIFLMNRIKY